MVKSGSTSESDESNDVKRAEDKDTEDDSNQRPKQLDEVKRKGILNQLTLILHANKCLEREKSTFNHPPQIIHANKSSHRQILAKEQSAGQPDIPKCGVEWCGRMREILLHLRSGKCPRNDSCTMRSCNSSRKIIQHWQTCNDVNCPVCSEVRKMPTFRKPIIKTTEDAEEKMGDPGLPLKEWHKTFPDEKRMQMRDKFKRDLMIGGQFTDQDRAEKITLKVEHKTFVNADNAEVYYYQLADQLYTAQRELLFSAGVEPLASYEKCPICLLDIFPTAANTRTLRCRHSFHRSCVNNWMRDHNSCPVCRSPVIDTDTYLLNL